MGRLVRPTVAVLALALMASCGSGVTEPKTDKGKGVSFSNCERELDISGTPEAVVGLSPSQTELLMHLGLTDRLVGQAQTDTAALPKDLRDEAADIPVLSDDAPPTREALLEANPDFVFAPTSYEFTAEQGFASLEQLEDAGVDAYIATGGCPDRRMSGTVDDLYTDLENLGAVFDVEKAARKLADDAESELEDIAGKIDGRDKPRVAQVYVEGKTLSAIGAGIEHDIVRLAGGDNVFGPDDAAFADFFAAEINPESLAKSDPQALIFTARDDEQEKATVEYLKSTFPDMTAVKNDRLIAISSADVYPGTLGNVDAVRRIAEGLYPDAF